MVEQRNIFIINMLVATLLLVSLCTFVHFFNEYKHMRVVYENSSNKLLAANQKKKKLDELKVYSSNASQVNNLLKNLDYSPDKWKKYSVDINKGVPFEDLHKILSQTNHGEDYFFVANELKINLPEEGKPQENKNIDAHIELKGYYLVRK